MLVRDVMNRPVVTIGRDDSLQDAANRMKDRGVGALVVCDGERVVGIVTDRDVVVRGVAAGVEPATTPVGSLMTPHVVDGCDTEDLEKAVRRMEHAAVRRLVVLDGAGHLAGMLTADDVAARNPSLAGDILDHAVLPGLPAGPRPWWEESVP